MPALRPLASLLLAALLVTFSAAARAEELKIATLVPLGSAWAKSLEKGGSEIERRTDGRVKTRYYFGGIEGDERDVVRKMKLGQLDGAVLSGVGLGLIGRSVLVLQLPGLFRNEKEVDAVRDRLAPELERRFAEAGYVLLSWGDLGWVYLLTKTLPKNAEELRRLKYWLWPDDPLMRAQLERQKLSTVALSPGEVLTALSTGSLDACYNSLLGMIALKWYTQVHYAYAPPAVYGIGAMLVRKEILDRLSPADRAVVLEVSRSVGLELIAQVRRDEVRARRTLEKAGVTFVDIPADLRAEIDRGTHELWDALADDVYPRELLKRVLDDLAEVRKGQGR